jgi:hypothetical protein
MNAELHRSRATLRAALNAAIRRGLITDQPGWLAGQRVRIHRPQRD